MVSETLLCRSGCGANLIQGDESRGVSGGHLRQILHARDASGQTSSRTMSPKGGWAVRVGEGQSLILKTSVLKAKESAEKGGKLSVPGSPVAGSSGTTRILS
ncbi:hypothetical protein E3N88_43780 [Mikania micrantha]|uniref:Uncharacterized protein n=1 Tax=Mikania micrantha TaxID=192012 RepID=A0A5N6LG61_9ASTR|nr:hypothetical protein E3N88_43780 [Mikania micrantha]